MYSTYWDVTTPAGSEAHISHEVAQGEILCSTRDNTTYQGDRYCLFVTDDGNQIIQNSHLVKCDDRPVSGDVEELKKLGNTAVCHVGRVHPSSHLGIAYYDLPDELCACCVCVCCVCLCCIAYV